MEGQFDRVKGADWFPHLLNKEVMVLGQGGIGSWTSLLLARAGCNLTLVDMDVYETHNMTGQLVRGEDIGRNKAEVSADIVRSFSPSTTVDYYTERYAEGSFVPFNKITICGFDNMEARKTAFSRWKAGVLSLPEESRKGCFFQDGRLLAEQLQVFNIRGDDTAAMEKYEKEYLFDDSAVADAVCTFKQTSHGAAMIASHMVGFLTNHISNVYGPVAYRQVPFFYQYLIPLNKVL